eukprot:scaffold85449_cov63-Phaeocystis_antarctica.AAC.4
MKACCRDTYCANVVARRSRQCEPDCAAAVAVLASEPTGCVSRAAERMGADTLLSAGCGLCAGAGARDAASSKMTRDERSDGRVRRTVDSSGTKKIRRSRSNAEHATSDAFARALMDSTARRVRTLRTGRRKLADTTRKKGESINDERQYSTRARRWRTAVLKTS